ncbi:MAG: GNAT family N-acetyltransferase [Chitinophagaceae bacterium]
MQNTRIIQPDLTHAQALIDLAKITWQHTYPGIISQEQIDYMLNLFYSQERVEQQLRDTNQFFSAIEQDGHLQGYIHAYPENQSIKVSKLYILPEAQGKGFGQMLLATAEQEAIRLHLEGIRLNVNRYNPAYHFYLKQGFVVEEEIDIPLDRFVLNDYIMFKRIGI